MSALARWFHRQGVHVSGYDRALTPLTAELQQEGISVHYSDAVSDLPQQIIQQKDKTLVVYTPAIPKDHKGLDYLLKNGYTLMKRSQVLGKLTENRFTVAVAGTHGKTTTSTMIAHIINHVGQNCDAFLGGISTNWRTNLLQSEKPVEESIMVVEADEFDRSFLTLHPNITVVTSADPDHLDIYGDKNKVLESFADFIAQGTEGNQLIIKEGLEHLKPLSREDIVTSTYSLSGLEISAQNVTIKNDVFVFDYVSKQQTIEEIALKVPGYHNVENAVAACTAALKLDLDPQKIREALGSFAGVKRRFEYIVRSEKAIYIDDYAHHPVEVRAFLSSVRALYPSRKIKAIFQPHLYSRTRDFISEFGESLSLADEVLLLEIYPAREQPIEGISSSLLLNYISAENKRVCTVDDLLQRLIEDENDVLVTIGAGDIDKLVQPIGEILRRKNHGK